MNRLVTSATRHSNYAPEPLQQRSESELVEQARGGDREAFGELVRRHRAQALGWASSLLQDVNLAEDIVQDALIRAFLYLGTLSDSARFIPWLHRIVRNQANMRLRRGGPYGRERPFTSMERADTAPDDVNWKDIDAVLFHLQSKQHEREQAEQDPAVRLMRKEMLDAIRATLDCLSQRERSIFEAHFFRQLPPDRLATLMGTSTANVYNLISRSRKKVQRERIRVHFHEFARRNSEEGRSQKKVLARPFEFQEGSE